jgi:hypothetical protein
MATVLSYAPPERWPMWRSWLGVVVAVVGVCSAGLIAGGTLYTRYLLASYVQVGWCGTPRATLRADLHTMPVFFVIPLAALAGAERLGRHVAVCRVSMMVAIFGWAVCAFVG